VPEVVEISISDLLLDPENPRFKEIPKTQQEAAKELAEKHGDQVVELAGDVVRYGLDPTTLPAVVASGDMRQRYRMLEGNRRLLAIKALETPTLISGVLAPSLAKRLTELSKAYVKNPIATMPCVLFEKEKDAEHWILLRHTRGNKGIGLVTWGTDEQERYERRHSGKLKPAGQVIEFVEQHGTLSPEAQASNQRINTNVARLIETTAVREQLGIGLDDGDIVSLYPTEEVAKGLSKIVDDLKTNKINVPDLYRAEQRVEYVKGLGRKNLPKKATALSEPAVLSDLASGRTSRKVKQRKKRTSKKQTSRTTVATGTALNITPPRINAIYNELLTLNAEQYPNACAVLLRVFIELSVDHLIEDKKLMSERDREEKPLKERLKIVAKHLKKTGAVSNSLQRSVNAVADGQSSLAPGISNLNQYVHNKYTFPKPAEQYAAWDELAPFLEKVWA
jgi:hypothetical protein